MLPPYRIIVSEIGSPEFPRYAILGSDEFCFRLEWWTGEAWTGDVRNALLFSLEKQADEYQISLLESLKPRIFLATCKVLCFDQTVPLEKIRDYFDRKGQVLSDDGIGMLIDPDSLEEIG